MNGTPSHVTFSRTCMHSFQSSSMCYPHVVVVLILFDPVLCTLHRLSHLPFHSPVLHLPSSMWVGWMRSPIRTSANEELGTLAENNPLTGYEPNFIDNYHIQRPLTYSSRSPPATAGPQICMTWRSMTAPSAERSLHHCFRSENIQRAVDKLITLLTKACQVSRCLSVM